jgi:hypothetical protein
METNETKRCRIKKSTLEQEKEIWRSPESNLGLGWFDMNELSSDHDPIIQECGEEFEVFDPRDEK